MARERVFRAGVLVSILFAISALLGLVREIVLAAYFGASSQADAFLVAMLIPQFFIGLLGEASLGAAVVPVFISHIAPQATQDQRRIIGSGFALISLVLVPLTALAILAAPTLSRLFAPGFSQENLRLTASLMRIMLPSVVFLGLANFVTGILHSFKRFGAAAATSAVLNLTVVVATIPLARSFGITAPALGVLLGSILLLAIMLPSLAKTGLLTGVGFRFRDPALRRIGSVFWPILAGSLLVQLIQIIDKIVASFLPHGSIAALYYAGKLCGGPSRIFAMAMAVVLFPSFAEDVLEKSPELARRVRRGMTMSAGLTLPWAAVLIALRVPIVTLLLQRGAFDARATFVVAAPLAIYAPGMFADGAATMLNNFFYSHHDSRTPAAIHLVTKILRVALVLALLGQLGYLSVPLAHVITLNVSLLLLLVSLKRTIVDLDLGSIAWSIARIAAASTAGGLTAWFAFQPIAALLGPRSTVALAGSLAFSAILALVAYVIAARVLGIREIAEMIDRTRALVTRRRAA